jgi:hypothetical protein
MQEPTRHQPSRRRVRHTAASLSLAAALVIAMSGCELLGISFFEVLSIDAPTTISYGTSRPVSVTYIGNPEFPVAYSVEAVRCAGTNFTCNDFTGVVSRQTNPITFSIACQGIPGGSPGTATWQIRLTDATDLRTSPAEFTITCR